MPDPKPEEVREDSLLASEGAEEPQAPSPAFDEENPFSSMMERFDEAAAHLGLSPDAYTVLRLPDRQFKFAIPIRYPDGEVRVHKGYRIRHNLSMGPCLGGLRLEADLKREELAALAGWATWKYAALGIPFGGSAGGVDYDPRGQDPATTEAVVRRYTAGLLDLLGPEQDILSPDLHCNEQIMAWCLDTYSMHVRHTENAVVVGKPEELAGTHGRDCAVHWCSWNADSRPWTFLARSTSWCRVQAQWALKSCVKQVLGATASLQSAMSAVRFTTPPASISKPFSLIEPCMARFEDLQAATLCYRKSFFRKAAMCCSQRQPRTRSLAAMPTRSKPS
jgi:hypothetical protein